MTSDPILVVDPNLELRGGGGVFFLALPAFLPSTIFLPKIREGVRPPPPDPSPRSATAYFCEFATDCHETLHVYFWQNISNNKVYFLFS